MLNPIPASTVNRPSEVERRVLCSRYSACLEICLSKGWQSFSCSDCLDFEFECPDDSDHWVEQGNNSKNLLMSAGYVPGWIVDRVRNSTEPDHIYLDFIQ
jgi:hypothetical protein